MAELCSGAWHLASRGAGASLARLRRTRRLAHGLPDARRFWFRSSGRKVIIVRTRFLNAARLRRLAAASLLAALGFGPVLPPVPLAAQPPLRADTTRAAAPASVDTVAPPRRSPRGAFLRSLVLPGWGQAWVGSPGRGSAYFAAEAGSLWMLYRTQRRLSEARQRQDYLRRNGLLSPDSTLALVRSREDQREDWITLSVFLLFFSGADAYVAAQLADFDERVSVRPTPDGGVRVGARVPLGRRR